MQPATRARALALLSQLSRIQFAEGKAVSEQLRQFEALINEYEKISGHGYSDDAKVAAVLLACPMQIRQHLHLWITDTTTYEQLKNRIIQLEKDKGKSKDGKGSWKSYEKGKSTWEKGPGKKGKPTDKGSKGGKSTGACHLCGKVGHFAKDCWKRVNQVEEQTNPGGASSSSTGAGPSTVQSSTAIVKMVRIEAPPGTPSMEVFDLTTPRGSGDNFPWRVGMVRCEQDEGYETADEEYMECHEPRVDVPAGVSIVAMDLQDDEELYVNMVKIEGVNADNCLVTLDTGADVSVLPKTFASVGEWQQGSSELKMIDAQGKRIAHDGVTRVRIRVEDKRGKPFELVEEFVLGNVQHPILCAGKLLRRGWSLQRSDDGLELRHDEKGIEVPVNTERNSLQLEARICVVSEAISTSSPTTSTTSPTARVLALTGYLSKYVQDLELAPGWHRLPKGVVVYSDPVAVRLADPKDNIEKAYKSRLTLVKEKNGQWTQLEKEDDITEKKPHIFRKIGLNDEPHRTLSFFAPTKFRDQWEPESEVPISPFPEPEDAIKATAWSDDDGEEIEEMEQQVEHHDIEKRVIAQHPHEVELDETLFSEKTSVKDLQMARKERKLGTHWKQEATP